MKNKPSGPALFMYCVIALTAMTATVCFWIYYGKIYMGSGVLWTGITCFTVMYHLWMRILMGNVTKLFEIRYNRPRVVKILERQHKNKTEVKI